MKITIKKEDLLDPMDSQITTLHLEDAGNCDGAICGELFFDDDGEEIQPGPHHHLVLRGKQPETSLRHFAIFSNRDRVSRTSE